MATEAPPIRQAMNEWIALGGRSSGILANLDTHDSGFHLSVKQLRSLGKGLSDYSVRHDPNGPDGPFMNDDYACAGDFWHGGNEQLRAKHREVFERLRDNDPSLSMICEAIGQPYADQPVKYWARWRGFGNLSNYTGSGHGTWSHFSWYRSRANQRAALWTSVSGSDEGDEMSILGLKYNDRGERVKELQWLLTYAGFDPGEADGHYGDKTAVAVKAACGGVDGKAIFGIHSARLTVRLAERHAGKDGEPGKLVLPGEFIFKGTIQPAGG